MKLITIVNAHDAIDGFAEKADIGAHLAYWMTKFVLATQPEVDFYRMEMHKLLEKCGIKTENGNFTIANEHMDEFVEKVKELEETDVDAPKIQFSLSEMSRELKLSMKQIYPLMDFIKDDE